MEGNNDNEKQNITLHIYDTQIPIAVLRSQEQNWREAGKLVNDRLNAYYGNYKGVKSDKEIMYYAMIDLALRCVGETRRNDVSPFIDILTTLSEEIDEALKC